jgi:hypothetical protein
LLRFNHILIFFYFLFLKDPDDGAANEEEDTTRNYQSNRNQVLANSKRNNKVLSKISASNKQQKNDDDSSEKQMYDKTGTNLVVNSQIERNNTELQNDDESQMTAAFMAVNNNRNSHQLDQQQQQKGHRASTYISTTQSSARQGYIISNESSFEIHNSERVSTLATNRQLDDSNDNNLDNDSEQANIETIQNQQRPAKSNKKLSLVLSNSQPIYQPKSSAFSLTYGKESQSSNENIDNGYHTMTHTTPHHHLMEDDNNNNNNNIDVAHNKNDKKQESQKAQQQKGSSQKQQLGYSKVYNDDQQKYRNYDKNPKKSEIYEEESQSEEEDEDSISHNTRSVYTKTQDSGIGSLAPSKARKQMNAAKAKGKELRKSNDLKNTLPSRKDIDKRYFNNNNNNSNKESKDGQRGVPVAKAYEGSDSGEEIDNFLMDERYQDSAAANRSNRLALESQQNMNSVLRNYAPKYSPTDDGEDSYYEAPIEAINRHNNNNKNNKRNNKETKLRESKKMMKNRQDDEEETVIEDGSTHSSDASSVIYREKPVKTTKR